MGQLFASVFKGAPLEHVRVEVGREELRVSRHDMVYEDVLATKVLANFYFQDAIVIGAVQTYSL